MNFESTQDTHCINRWQNAVVKAKKASDRLHNQPMNERLFYAEQYAKHDVLHTRSEMVRRIKMFAWNEAHDSLCPTIAHECEEHVNPYVLKNQDLKEVQP